VHLLLNVKVLYQDARCNDKDLSFTSKSYHLERWHRGSSALRTKKAPPDKT